MEWASLWYVSPDLAELLVAGKVSQGRPEVGDCHGCILGDFAVLCGSSWTLWLVVLNCYSGYYYEATISHIDQPSIVLIVPARRVLAMVARLGSPVNVSIL